MFNRNKSGIRFYLSTLLFLTVGCSSYVFASGTDDTDASLVDSYLLTQNDNVDPDKSVPGRLILPSDSSEKKGEEEKKCMTVCAQWGEECNYINRGSAGTTRSCRRMCKQYTEECF